MSAFVVFGCQGLLHALSRDILNGFHFSRDLELMRKQLDFFSTSLYPFLILFIQYIVFSTLVLVAPSGHEYQINSNHWFPVASFPVQITAHPYGVEFHQQPCIGFRLRNFWCKEFYPLVLWIWNQHIAISTIVGTSSHNTLPSWER